MAKYLVRLAAPVIYQPDHPKARREITELVVSAADAEQAKIHLYRSTLGNVQIAEVLPYEPPPPTPLPIEDGPTIEVAISC